jgi:hypothetical protein
MLINENEILKEQRELYAYFLEFGVCVNELDLDFSLLSDDVINAGFNKTSFMELVLSELEQLMNEIPCERPLDSYRTFFKCILMKQNDMRSEL